MCFKGKCLLSCERLQAGTNKVYKPCKCEDYGEACKIVQKIGFQLLVMNYYRDLNRTIIPFKNPIIKYFSFAILEGFTIWIIDKKS